MTTLWQSLRQDFMRWIRPARYYVMYWVSPIPAFTLAILYDTDEPLVNTVIVSVVMLSWWLLAMLTEETMRLAHD